MVLKNELLLLFSSTSWSHQFLVLIVVPDRLHRSAFVAFHASDIGTYIEGWKTMTIILIRFYWSHMHKAILEWVNM